MNIGNVGNNGGIDRTGDRPARTEAKRSPGAHGSAKNLDRAAISSDGREAATAFEARVAAAAREEPDRAAKVARAIQRLIGGELDTEAVHREVASRLLASDFHAI